MQYMHPFGQMWFKHPCILHLKLQQRTYIFTGNYSESLNFVDITIGCKENIVHAAYFLFLQETCFHPLPYTYGPHSLPSLRHEIPIQLIKWSILVMIK